MGRKATGPSGTAELPKQEGFCGPVVQVNTGLFVRLLEKGKSMVLEKICKYYQNSKCLLKHTHCDLLCSQMKFYGGEESDGWEEEPFKHEKSHSSHSKEEEPIGFL